MGLFCNCEERYMRLVEVMMAYSSDLMNQQQDINKIKTSLERIEKHTKQECKKKPSAPNK